MTNDPRVLLATSNAGYAQSVRNAFDQQLNSELTCWDADKNLLGSTGLVSQLANLTPDVVAIGPDVVIEDALELARQLERERPEITVLLISDPTPELWQVVVQSGVRDILAPTAPHNEVRTAFERALTVAARRRTNLVGDTATPTRTGRVITVLCPKGGSGKTTMASNLAVGLARLHPDEVAILDLDLQFGDVATALGLTPEHSFLDIAATTGTIDALVVKSFLTSHRSNLWALCAPDAPEDGEEVSVDRSQATIRTLADEFAYVVIDTGAGLSEQTLAAIELSTDLVLMCSMDVPSVRSLRKEIDALDRLGMTQQRRHLVINRVDGKAVLDLDDIEATLGMQANATIPTARNVSDAMNQGSPVLERDYRSPAGRQLTQLVERFTEQPLHGPRRRWLASA